MKLDERKDTNMRRHRPIMNAIKNPCSCQTPNPSVTRIAGPPAPVRVAAWAPYSPYWQAGLATAAALSAGAVPKCPPGSVPRTWGQNWYCVPKVWRPSFWPFSPRGIY
jgi:hypothetical protein